jgi:hypothetical protein
MARAPNWLQYSTAGCSALAVIYQSFCSMPGCKIWAAVCQVQYSDAVQHSRPALTCCPQCVAPVASGAVDSLTASSAAASTQSSTHASCMLLPVLLLQGVPGLRCTAHPHAHAAGGVAAAASAASALHGTLQSPTRLSPTCVLCDSGRASPKALAVNLPFLVMK